MAKKMQTPDWKQSRTMRVSGLQVQNIELGTHEFYQRCRENSVVQRIVSDFLQEAFLPLCVGIRQDGSAWVVDGFQRLCAAIELGFLTVPVYTFESAGEEHEARVFEKVNIDRKNVNSDVKHAMYCTQGESIALAMRQSANDSGYCFRGAHNNGSGLKSIRGTGAVRNSFKEDPVLAGKCMKFMNAICDGLAFQSITWKLFFSYGRISLDPKRVVKPMDPYHPETVKLLCRVRTKLGLKDFERMLMKVLSHLYPSKSSPGGYQGFTAVRHVLTGGEALKATRLWPEGIKRPRHYQDLIPEVK